MRPIESVENLRNQLRRSVSGLALGSVAAWTALGSSAQAQLPLELPALPTTGSEVAPSVPSSLPSSATAAIQAESFDATPSYVGANQSGKSDRNNQVRLVTRDELRRDASIVRAMQPKVIELEALDDAESPPVVTALAADSSESYLAIAGDDHAIRIYSVKLDRVIYTGAAHVDWIHALAFASSEGLPDTQVPELYSAGDDGIVYQWNQGEPPVAIAEFGFAIRSLSLSTEKQLLAICGFDERIVLWNIATRQYQMVIDCDCDDLRTVRFSPDGSRLLCAGRDGQIHVWDPTTGAEIAHYTHHRRRVRTAGFSVDGKSITSVGDDRRLVQYDLAAGNALPKTLSMPAKLKAMCLINDSIVAIAGADNSIQLFDFTTDRVVANLESHEGTVAVLCPFGKLLASGSFDTTVRIWDLEALSKLRQSKQQPVSYSPIQFDEKLRVK